jgi:hypothetical protein
MWGASKCLEDTASKRRDAANAAADYLRLRETAWKMLDSNHECKNCMSQVGAPQNAHVTPDLFLGPSRRVHYWRCTRGGVNAGISPA